MKIIEQYLYEVGRRIPAKNREDTTNELRSLLLDELEEKYGPDADEEAAKELLLQFGSPAEVAARYSGRSQVIATGLSDLYFLIMRIILGAMAIAFTVVYIVEAVSGSIPDGEIVVRTLGLPFQILSAYLTGAGALTLIFIGITRLGWNEGLDPNADWTPEELKDVKIEPESESKFSHIISIAGGMVAIALLNVYPGIFTALEDSFLLSTLSLGHRLNVDLFRGYIVVITVILAFEIVYHAASLRRTDAPPWLRLARTGITLATVINTAIIVGDMRLYIDYENILGFRLIFTIALVGNVIELIKEIVEYVKAKLLSTAPASA